MANFNSSISADESNKRSSNKKVDESLSSGKKKGSITVFVEKRRSIPIKSPPNPFMSRLNISSFLDLMMSDKNDQNYSKNRKNITGNNTPLFLNSVKSPKENSQFPSNMVANHSGGTNSATNATSHIDLFNSSVKSCPVCTNDVSEMLMDNFTNCTHVACIDCWQAYIINRIENYEFGYGFTCLTCCAELPYHKVTSILKLISDYEYSKKLTLRLENFYLERALLQDKSLRWCPHPGCEFGFFLISDFSDCPKLSKCKLLPICSGQLCGNQCVDFWKKVAPHDCIGQLKVPSADDLHSFLSTDRRTSKVDIDNASIRNNGPTIYDSSNESGQSRNFWLSCFPWRRSWNRKESRNYKSRRKINRGDDSFFSKSPISQIEVDEITSLASIKTSSSRTKFHHSNDQIQSEGEVKTCPKCHTYVLKMNDGSCNHMVCVVCGCEFCWLCMRQITDMHYLSPSGCTFWGRRQWNVEKRALWQLGTLIGAPVAIGFLAALAIPAMVIGIPLYVGRKIHGALKTKNKDRKRTLAVAGGIGAFIVSPVIAAVAVGLGVPLILAYVYVVMPIALCRASACSCDENIPPRDEVDFSDVATIQPTVYNPVPDQSAQSSTKSYVETVVITRLPLYNDQVAVSQSQSINNIAQTPLQRVGGSWGLDRAIPLSSQSGLRESQSESHLPTATYPSPGIVTPSRYSDPLLLSAVGDLFTHSP